MSTIYDLLRRSSQRRAEHTAYIYPATAQDFTWKEVAARSNRLAAALSALGVGKGDRVATLFYDSPLHNETIFALARLGAVRIGLNYRYSPAEIDVLVRHSGADYGMCSADLSALVADSSVQFMSCGNAATDYGDLEPILGVAGDPPDTEVAESDLATICYTTGSTGAPKGAMWSHRNVTHALSHTALDAAMSEDDVWLHCLPGAGVPGLLGIWHAVTGWTNVVLPSFDPQLCLQAIEDHGVTATVWVPTMLGAVLDIQEASPVDCSRLRKVVYGSAPTTPAMIRRAIATFPDTQIEQWYGSTEGAGGWYTRLSHTDHERAMAGEEQLLQSCGQAMHHVDIDVVDERGVTLPAGENGEIRVRSDSVMVGYLDVPEQTMETLSDGWLHTGDLGHQDEDGFVYLVDRKQFMIISGGYNVYPVEVENVLAEHSGVSEVCVFGVPDERWGEAVHALVVLRSGDNTTPDELIEFSRGALASFKVPKIVETVAELLKGPTGKIQKREHKAEYWPESR